MPPTPSADELALRVQHYCSFNSYTFNPSGVRRAAELAAAELQQLGGTVELLPVPPAETISRSGDLEPLELGPAVRALFNPQSPRRILLSIHLDTVYPQDHPFSSVWREGDRLRGPGVVDAKGGLIVLLEGLRQYLAAPGKNGKHGIEVLLNPDEEISSPSSKPLLELAASRCVAGLVFEPTFPDGAMVSARKGSGTYTIVVRGRSAHAGRDFELGRNALVAAAAIAVELANLNGSLGHTTVNPGVMESGSAPNVVPDRAVLRVNVRVETPAQIPQLDAAIRDITTRAARRDGISVDLHGGVASPPRTDQGGSGELLGLVLATASKLGLPTTKRPSGGTCDGNKLAAAGLPTADSMGPTGGNLHSDLEYLEIPSLPPRAQLLAQVLARL